MKKMVLVMVALFAAIFMIGMARNTASADSVYRRLAIEEIDAGSEELMTFIKETTGDLLTKMIKGEIDKFEFFTEKDGQLVVETSKKGKIFTKTETITTDYYLVVE